jgi:Zn-dependent protease
LDSQLLALGLVWFVVFVFSTTCHEAGHAWAALKLGDPTAYLGGQVSLNPLPHVQREPFGMVLVPLLSFGLSGGTWMFGWASAPFNPHWAAHFPKRSALMALAGPAANLILIVLSGLALRLGFAAEVFALPDPAQRIGFDTLYVGTSGASEAIATGLSVAFTLNVVLFVFNLIPVPPLDGSGALPLLLPARLVARYREWFSHPAMGFLGLIVAWRISGLVIYPALLLAVGLLHR